jgi:hypothetical protein
MILLMLFKTTKLHFLDEIIWKHVLHDRAKFNLEVRIFETSIAKFKKLCYFCTPNSGNESQLDILAR